MARYVTRRLLESVVLLFIISIIVFALVMNIGDPVATMGGREGLNTQDYLDIQRKLRLLLTSVLIRFRHQSLS